MGLYFENVMFSVSSVPGSRKASDQLHFCVNLVFESQADLEAYAVAHGKVAVQQVIRYDIDIQTGEIERPSGYKDYKLKAVAEGVLPKDAKFTANCTVNHKGVIQPTLDDQLEEARENLKRLMMLKEAADKAKGESKTE